MPTWPRNGCCPGCANRCHRGTGTRWWRPSRASRSPRSLPACCRTPSPSARWRLPWRCWANPSAARPAGSLASTGAPGTPTPAELVGCRPWLIRCSDRPIRCRPIRCRPIRCRPPARALGCAGWPARCSPRWRSCVVWFALIAPNRLEQLTPGNLVRIPIEGLVLVGLGLVLPGRARRAFAVAVGLLLGLLMRHQDPRRRLLRGAEPAVQPGHRLEQPVTGPRRAARFDRPELGRRGRGRSGAARPRRSSAR